MLKNYFKVAWRQLRRKRYLSIIKVFGLGVGICASLLLMKYISWQWNFGRFHVESESIVRINTDHLIDGVRSGFSAETYSGVPVIAKERFPEVLDYVRMGRWIANDVEFRFEENLFRGRNCFFTDPSFFDVFSFKLLKGDPKTALMEPNSLVLTEKTAAILFGDADPIGKELVFESQKNFKVTGVVENPPTQSHMQFEILGSLSTMTNWGLQVYDDKQLNSAYVYGYLLLEKDTDTRALEEKISADVSRLKSMDEGMDIFQLQPLEEIHLYSEVDNEMEVTGEGNNIWILTSIAFLILFLGWVNHFNLFSANVLDQTQELGIRSVVGAGRMDLFFQLTISGLLFSLLGLGVGILLSLAVEPYVQRIFDIPIGDVSYFDFHLNDPAFYILVIVFLGTILNAVLPSIALSNIKAVSILPNYLIPNAGKWDLRGALVVFQFVIIVALIAATAIISNQNQFMREKDLGMNLENVLAIRCPLGTGYENVVTKYPHFKAEINAMHEVLGMSVSHEIPGNQLELLGSLGLRNEEYSFSFYRSYGDQEFFDLYEVPYVVRDTTVSPLSANDRYYVINETAARLLGFLNPEDALHEKLKRWGDEIEIVGVVKDYHQRSLHHSKLPIVYDFSGDNTMSDGYYSMRINGAIDQDLLRKIQAHYSNAFPNTIFEPIIVSDYFASQYQMDDKFKRLNLAFTLLGSMIACLGLLGLMMIKVEKRTKELSIRKVLGATVSGLVILLSKDILKITLIAWLIATPMVWYLMDQWLNNFSARIEIGWTVFLFTGMAVAAISILTTSVQALRAAMADPASILRDG